MRLGLLRGGFGRWLGCTLAWITVIVLVAAGANLVGIRLVGDMDGWRQWLDEGAGYFLIWRICLYGATVYGWIWMRRRVRARDPSVETHQRLRRAEIGTVAAVALLEVSLHRLQP